MKSDKTLIQKFNEFWTVEPHQCTREEFTDDNGVFYEKSFNDIQKSFNKEAKDQQMSHRIAVVYLILLIPMIILIMLSLFKIVICLGLFIGIVGMLLG